MTLGLAEPREKTRRKRLRIIALRIEEWAQARPVKKVSLGQPGRRAW